MFIRILHSPLPLDFTHELSLLNCQVDDRQLFNHFNPSLTFKFGNISPPLQVELTTLFKKRGISYWESQRLPEISIIASFPDWYRVEVIMTELSTSHPALEEVNQGLRENFYREKWEFHLPSGKIWKIDRPQVMGILNVTPDSFSDGGRFLKLDRAVDHALQMEAEGADMIDIGAESTRPGAEALGVEEEWGRLEKVLSKIAAKIKIPISIDSYKAEIARRALANGAEVVNDISGLTFDPVLKEIVADVKCPLIMMHIKGTPRNMQQNPFYQNVMEEIFLYFQRQLDLARRYGIHQIIIDPGIGFGKRLEDNLELLRRLEEFRIFGFPLMVGPSRKSYIGKILGVEVGERQWGTAASVAIAVANGARILRVHDVKEMKQVVEISRAILEKKIDFFN